LLCALVACSGARAALVQPALPARILPPSILGFEVRAEPSAAKAFKTSYRISLVADGKVFTLRRNGLVLASLQTSVLKAEYSTRKEVVRRGIRSSIELGEYRWFKLAGQWIGEQSLQEVRLYLWMPPGGHLFEVLVAKPELGIPKALLSAIVTYQRSGT
jgi:hypothetical protein